MKLVNIGFGNFVAAGRVLAVLSPESAPIKRMIAESRERGLLVDASFGRKTKTVLLMDSGHALLSALQPDALAARIGKTEGDTEAEDGQE